MSRMFPLRHVLFAAFVFFTAPLLFAQVPLPSERDRWIKLEADRFDIYSNASASQTVDVATELLRMRDAIGQLTKMTVRAPLRTKVYLFTSERSFAPYRDAAFQQKNAAVGGAFFSSANDNIIMIQADSGEQSLEIVFHELTHYLVANTTRGLPLWFNEGLAEYYSTFKSSGKNVSIGKPVREHVLWLRANPLIPLRELFATTQTSRAYNERQRLGAFYAQSWALVHYLLRGTPEQRAQLSAFLSALDADKPLDQAFSTAFKMSYDDLERDLKTYVRHFAFEYMTYAVTSPSEQKLGKPEPLPREEVLTELGNLLAVTNRANAADAQRFYDAALQVNPKLPAAHAGLARLHDEAGRTAEAAGAYERAVQLGTDDPVAYVLYGNALMRPLIESGDTRNATAAIARARQLFLRATQLDPASARAWAGLGATHVPGDSDPAEGIAALEKSLQLARGQEDVAFNLVALYVRAGRRADAAKLVQTAIAPGSKPEIVARAKEMLLYADVKEIEQLLDKDKRAEAVTLAKGVLAQTTDASLKEYLTGLLGQIEAMGAVDAAVKRLNEATEKANAGKFAEALAIVDETLPTITDQEMLARAKEFRAQLAARVATKTKRK